MRFIKKPKKSALSSLTPLIRLCRMRCDRDAVAPSGAFPLKSINDPIEMYLQDIFTIPANLAGLPAISVPSGFDSRHMPLGLQLMGPQMCDVPLIQYAHAFEQATRIFPETPRL